MGGREPRAGSVRESAPADTYRRVYYEDLVRDVRDTLTKLCSFLGEDFEEAMLEHADAAQDIVPARKHWHGRVSQQVDPARVEFWRTSLHRQEIGLIDSLRDAR